MALRRGSSACQRKYVAGPKHSRGSKVPVSDDLSILCIAVAAIHDGFRTNLKDREILELLADLRVQSDETVSGALSDRAVGFASTANQVAHMGDLDSSMGRGKGKEPILNKQNGIILLSVVCKCKKMLLPSTSNTVNIRLVPMSTEQFMERVWHWDLQML